MGRAAACYSGTCSRMSNFIQVHSIVNFLHLELVREEVNSTTASAAAAAAPRSSRFHSHPRRLWAPQVCGAVKLGCVYVKSRLAPLHVFSTRVLWSLSVVIYPSTRVLPTNHIESATTLGLRASLTRRRRRRRRRRALCVPRWRYIAAAHGCLSRPPPPLPAARALATPGHSMGTLLPRHPSAPSDTRINTAASTSPASPAPPPPPPPPPARARRAKPDRPPR